MPYHVTRECLTKVEKSNEQVDCDRTHGIAVDRQLPRTITFREDNSNVGMCTDPFLLPHVKGLVPRLVRMGVIRRGGGHALLTTSTHSQSQASRVLGFRY